METFDQISKANKNDGKGHWKNSESGEKCSFVHWTSQKQGTGEHQEKGDQDSPGKAKLDQPNHQQTPVRNQQVPLTEDSKTTPKNSKRRFMRAKNPKFKCKKN